MAPPPVLADPLFFLDYDGTLAPIVDDPGAAYPHPEAPPVLEALDARYPLWIVTGRNLQSLATLVDMPLHAIGLHGAQEGVIGGEIQRLMPEDAAAALAQLRRTVPDVAGVEVEDKDESFALHYRQADEDEARARIETWARAIPSFLEAIWGKKVVELRPQGLSKGTAVTRIAERFPDRQPLYIGDDVTDEDAFEALHTLNRPTCTVKVGAGETAATHRLADVPAVIDYLKQYVSD
ncbi:trehalose-phosphatase [Salisaeta longa]|uniref:trehalose-phosphatase n=1 Tax=Salisaeta longa TaxID=503170 RepID=UPI0003B64186|nr:trehalose-phosphatase [Salisaeta longa]